MTAGDRLRFLAGQAGAAGALLLLIGSGATAGDALVDYSGLPTGTAAQHLLADNLTTDEGGIGHGGIGHGGKKHELTQSEKQRLRDRAQTLLELRELETIPNEVTVEVSEIDKTVTLESKEIQTSTVNDVQVIADIYQLDESAILALLIALEDD